MKLVANTNILFSFFNKKSKAREIALHEWLELYTPNFALEEIKKYKTTITKKFELSELQFKFILKTLKFTTKFIKLEEYKELLPKAEKTSPDPNDADFFALAQKLNCPIWSNDKLLKKQLKVRILTTTELVKEMHI